jgi:hypothetical protein
MSGVMRQRSFPQGLKPAIIHRVSGTAKAVPFQNQTMNKLQ